VAAEGLHEETFAFFGGTVKTVRLDNLKEGVLKPDVYDPAIRATLQCLSTTAFCLSRADPNLPILRER
jgi:hypothetical protein